MANDYLVGGFNQPLWKIWLSPVGKDDIPYMKWKTKRCLKPPTSYIFMCCFFSPDSWDTNFRETLPVARQKDLWRSWAFKGCGASPLSRTVCSSHGGVVKSTSNDHHHHVFLIRGMLVFILGIHQRFNIFAKHGSDFPVRLIFGHIDTRIKMRKSCTRTFPFNNTNTLQQKRACHRTWHMGYGNPTMI